MGENVKKQGSLIQGLLKPIRYLKKLLTAIFLFCGAFALMVFAANCFGVVIQAEVVDGVFSAIRAESIVSGLIEISSRALEYIKERAEQKARHEEREAEQNKNAGDTGRKVD